MRSFSEFLKKYSLILLTLLMMVPSGVKAENSEIFVEQLSLPDGQVFASGSDLLASGDGDAPVFAGLGANEINLSLLGSTTNLSIIHQKGTLSSATVSIIGRQNATLQMQRGALNQSQIDIEGRQNRILVDQKGMRLNSDINVTGGENKTVLHIQRGHGNLLNSSPIDLSGSDAQRMIVVDTARGRRIINK